MYTQVFGLAAVTLASDCPAGQDLNEASGMNINIMYGNSTDDTQGQNNNIYNVNPRTSKQGLFWDSYETRFKSFSQIQASLFQLFGQCGANGHNVPSRAAMAPEPGQETACLCAVQALSWFIQGIAERATRKLSVAMKKVVQVSIQGMPSFENN